MIGRLRGQLLVKRPPHLLIEVNGVGYELEAPMSTIYDLPAVGETVTLVTHLAVREDAHVLYGFAREGDRDLFRALLKVTGVGAKMGLAVLSGMDAARFVQCVEQEDVHALTRLPGIGTQDRPAGGDGDEGPGGGDRRRRLGKGPGGQGHGGRPNRRGRRPDPGRGCLDRPGLQARGGQPDGARRGAAPRPPRTSSGSPCAPRRAGAVPDPGTSPLGGQASAARPAAEQPLDPRNQHRSDRPGSQNRCVPQPMPAERSASRGAEADDFLGRDTGAEAAGEPLDVTGHAGILNYQPKELVITARAGTTLEVIESALAEHGQLLPFEPPRFGPGATLGGTIACGLSGPARPYAGAARDLVLGTPGSSAVGARCCASAAR